MSRDILELVAVGDGALLRLHLLVGDTSAGHASFVGTFEPGPVT